MSTKQSNQAVAEKKKTADSSKTKYKRAAKGAGSKRWTAETKGKKTPPAKEAAKRSHAAAVEQTQSYKRRAVAESSTASAQEKKKERSKKRERKARVRIFPIWLRIIIVVILSAFALIAGLMIGYGVLGDGTPTDALKFETWQHLIDIVIKE